MDRAGVVIRGDRYYSSAMVSGLIDIMHIGNLGIHGFITPHDDIIGIEKIIKRTIDMGLPIGKGCPIIQITHICPAIGLYCPYEVWEPIQYAHTKASKQRYLGSSRVKYYGIGPMFFYHLDKFLGYLAYSLIPGYPFPFPFAPLPY